MKVKSTRSIYLSEKELKEAITDWLYSKGHFDLANHLVFNHCEFDWTYQDDEDLLAVDMDGIFEEKAR
jgi:hypothetical protein